MPEPFFCFFKIAITVSLEIPNIRPVARVPTPSTTIFNTDYEPLEDTLYECIVLQNYDAHIESYCNYIPVPRLVMTDFRYLIITTKRAHNFYNP